MSLGLLVSDQRGCRYPASGSRSIGTLIGDGGAYRVWRSELWATIGPHRLGAGSWPRRAA